MRKKVQTPHTNYYYRAKETVLTLSGVFTVRVIDALTGKIKQEQVRHNTVCTTGKAAIASVMNGEGTYTGLVNYVAVGTGTDAPAVGDTKLQTELARTTKAESSRASNVVTYYFSFGTGAANDTLKEVGAFINGTASADSGQLLDRTAINVTKTSSDILTITLTLSIT